ncbi:MAG: N-acetylmuramoyl-L-alanine amidase [Verrucomicrobiota bacterium]|nr:N-acetylmuramoyl-L-alanine amidase [Verrucomicrobiota bacterium]
MKTKTHSFIKSSALIFSAIAATTVAYGSGDYGPAIWNPPCNANYYTSGYGHKFHVVHDIEGYYQSTISYFKGCGFTSASVHYVTNGKTDYSGDAAPGEITQMISEANYAWHAICWNQHSTGTEHEGFESNPAWYTEAQYQASAGITKHIAEKFGWAKDRNHVVAHGQKSVPGWSAWASANLGIDPNCNTHTDPGPYWDWNHYMDLVNGGGTSSSVPVTAYTWATPTGTRALEIFGRGTGNDALHIWQTSPSTITAGAPWSAIYSTGGSLGGPIALGRNGNNIMEAFAVGNNGHLQHAWQFDWSWTDLGSVNMVGRPAIATLPDTRLEIFVRGTDGAMWHVWQDMIQDATHSGTTWSGPYSLLGSFSGDPAVGINGDNSTEVFAVGSNSHLQHAWFTPGVGWSAWYDLSSVPVKGTPAVGYVADTRLEIFVRGTDNAIWHIWQNDVQTPTRHGTTWSALYSLGGSMISDPAIGRNGNGIMECFAVGNNTHLQHAWQGPTVWTSFVDLDSGVSCTGTQPAVGPTADNPARLEIFCVGTDGTLRHIWQNMIQDATHSGTTWSALYSLGGSWKNETAAAPVADIILDNPAATLVGTWSTGTSATDKYGADYVYRGQGGGSSYAQYTPAIGTPGNYQIYEWHPQGSNRPTDAKHVVTYNGGSVTLNVNQQINGGTWNLLGTFNFVNGNKVQITDGHATAGQVVMADAIKFVYAP